LKREYLNLGKIHSPKEFRELEYNFLNQHVFNTQYGQIVYGPAKRKYMQKMDLITI